jgi:hypothetical protein
MAKHFHRSCADWGHSIDRKYLFGIYGGLGNPKEEGFSLRIYGDSAFNAIALLHLGS